MTSQGPPPEAGLRVSETALARVAAKRTEQTVAPSQFYDNILHPEGCIMEILLGAIADYIHKHVGKRAIKYALLAIIFALGFALMAVEWAAVKKATGS